MSEYVMSEYAVAALPFVALASRYFLEQVEPTYIRTYVEPITKMGDLKGGDQLAVKFEVQGKEFFHHGIYLGADQSCKLIDFGQINGIKETDLMEFCPQGQPLFRITYPDGPTLEPADVMLEALAFFHHEFEWGTFDILKNNCEHFATWCKTKLKASPQASQELQQNLIVKLFEFGKVAAAASSESFRYLSQ